ncbi:hypothetical protein SEVIR_7G340000v4 [Setaria viridis]|uniref:Uncharacterized protein n=1 Tax=Setaria viridis TaxID=4556 RepID=A0A4U6TY46_SETVI|nr:hypothetical protein SEVIR_7G340000v2 [Setaria viridis]
MQPAGVSKGVASFWGANYDMILFSFAIILWALWNRRNKLRIERKFPNSPCDVIFAISSYLQRWKILLQESDRDCLERLNNQVATWVKGFLAEERNQDLMEDFI